MCFFTLRRGAGNPPPTYLLLNSNSTETVIPTTGLIQLFILLGIRRLLHEIVQNLKPNRQKGKKQRKRNHFSEF